MEPHVSGAGLYWSLSPCTLSAASSLRFNALSSVYLSFLSSSPWLPGPSRHSIPGHTGRSLRALLCLSLLFSVAHLAFQICLHTVPHSDQFSGQNGSLWVKVSQHIGVTRSDSKDIFNTTRSVAPDSGVSSASSLCLGLCGRLTRKARQSRRTQESQDDDDDDDDDDEDIDAAPAVGSKGAPASATKRRSWSASRFRVTAHWSSMTSGRTSVIVLSASAGIAHPSAFSSIYSVVFSAICTWWSCHFPLSPSGFNTLCVMVSCFGAGHLICLYCYQTPFIQDMLPPGNIWARLFGLKNFVDLPNYSSPNASVLNTKHAWPIYVSPGISSSLYYTATSLSKLHKSCPSESRKETPREDEEHESESDHSEPEPQARDATQGEMPMTTEPDLDNCTVHVLTSQSPVRQRPVRPRSAESKEMSPLHGSGHLIMDQSYVCASIAMMVWSIMYHSWSTFVSSLWACLIWTVRSRHQSAMLCSPCISSYGSTLCCSRYVWAMELPESPTTSGPVSSHQLGSEHTRYPCSDLGAMLLYSLTFWLLSRQFVKEKSSKKQKVPAASSEVTVADTEPTQTQTSSRSSGESVTGIYVKYWIYVCAGMFIVVSFAGRSVVYKIVYMFLFSSCLTLFQVYYTSWRKSLRVFWWLVVAYTMLVLIAVYTFQFQDFPTYWRNLTGFTDEQLGDSGSEQFSVSELFSSILIPGFFSSACISQSHYFHRPFMQLTDSEHVPPPGTRHPRWAHRQDAVSEAPSLEHQEEEEVFREDGQSMDGPHQATQVPEGTASKWGSVADRSSDLAASFSAVLTRIQVFVRRLLELHVFKSVALYTVWVASKEVSVMNSSSVVLWAFALPYPRFRPMASCSSTVWTCIIIVCKMLYQLKIVNPHEYSSNCTEPFPNNTNLQPLEINQSLSYRGPVDPANWFGVRKGYPNLGYIQNHSQILSLSVFEAVVYRRQEHYRRQHQQAPSPAQAVCADGTRQRLDQDLLSCLKYFINFFFYKFGSEICFLMAVNVIGQRMNFMVILHGCWLVAILTRRRREAIARLWPNYCSFLTSFSSYQYSSCLGMPPASCIDYPWRWSKAIPMNSALIKWSYLPDFFRAPNSTNLISDFLSSLCASQQWQVFSAERTEEWQRMAGINTDHSEPSRGEPNPIPNFIHCRSYSDMSKVAVFRYSFWSVLVVVFVAGATRISIFGSGYSLACFYSSSFGTTSSQKDTRAQLVSWDCLILYNVTVIISKNMSSLSSCVFVEQMQSNFCWVIQLFSLVCTVKGYYDPKEMMTRDRDCSSPVEEAGIIWDSICFFFSLLQRRIFLSHYFSHVSADSKATASQASRGFALYNAANSKSINFHRQIEEKSSAQSKRQMKRIRAKQEKYRQSQASRGQLQSKDPQDPSQEPGPDSPGGSSPPRRQWWRPWSDHATVIHSGDYFSFESDSEEEEEALPEDPRPAAQSAFQMAYQAWVTNAQTVSRQRRERARQERAEQSASGGDLNPDVEPVDVPEDEMAGRSHMMQRVLSTMQFSWVSGQATVDGSTRWSRAFTKHHRTMSDVSCAERYSLTQELLRVGEVRRGVSDQLYVGEDEATLSGPVETRDGPSTASSGSGAEEPLSSMTDDTSSPSSTGYNTRSGSEEIVTDAGDLQAGTSSHGSQELLANARTRMRTASESLSDRRSHIPESEEAERFEAQQGRTSRSLRAGYQCVAAHSESLCYFIIILNHMVTASAASSVSPVLVFSWAMSTIPRPSKRFWMTAIVFTEVMVVTKYSFQFGFFPWNSYVVSRRYENKPYFPPRISGLEKTDSYIKYDSVQLMALFFHRSQLSCYGLWDHEEDRYPKDHCRSSVKDREAKEEPEAKSESQSETGTGHPKEPVLAGTPRDHIQGKGSIRSKDVIQDPPEDLKPRHTRHISIRFRRRKETPGPKGTAVMETEHEEGEGKETTERKRPRHTQEKSKFRERMKAAGRRSQSFCVSSAQSFYQPLQRFFHDISHTKYRAATDVYALMFSADIVDIIIIIFGFWAFGKHSAATDIASSSSDDQVPQAFSFMSSVQFGTMVIDRALYSRKTVSGKSAFQVVSVVAIHIWMFFILPAVTERMFSQNAVAQSWYFVKCIYFASSAYQIRCGYPTRILGNFLTKKYNHLNLFLFQGFRLVPFSVESRAVMDWVWTDTTSSSSNWMCVEDIYANIFIIKCSRETEKKYPQPKGQKKKKIVKYGMGGLIILFLIAIIWFPSLFMSSIRSVVGVVNQPIDVTVTLKLGGYEPSFTMSAQQPSIVPFTPQAYEESSQQFDPYPLAMQFISQYSPEDIVTAQIEGSSGASWRISPPSRAQMKQESYNGTADITSRFTWNFQRDSAKGGTVEYTNEKHTLESAPNSTARRQSAQSLEGRPDQSVVIPHLFPKYIRAPNGPEANPVKQSQPDEEEDYLGVRIQSRREQVGTGASGEQAGTKASDFLEWWVIESQDCKADCNSSPMVIFSDKVSPPSSGFSAGYGIVGSYVSIVSVVGKFVRGFFSEISHSIMFEESPCVDRILKSCQDIFLVRETRESESEEELYAKLIFSYRSPETMIKWTRERE